jgi:hypothetical protein
LLRLLNPVLNFLQGRTQIGTLEIGDLKPEELFVKVLDGHTGQLLWGDNTGVQ